MLDKYWFGNTSRISPEAPVPVVHVEEDEVRPGGAGNVALNTAKLGLNTQLFSLTGADAAAASLLDALSERKVDCHFEQINSHPTITKLRVISHHQQLIRLDFEQGFAAEHYQQLLPQLKEAIEQVGAVVISDYGKGVRAIVQSVITIAKQCGVPVLIDPKGAQFDDYKGASLITPNLAEFEAVVGHCGTQEILVEKGLQLIEQHALDALLVTQGEQGMTLLQQGKAPFHLPAQAIEVFDVTGAGDTVIALMASAVAAGISFQDATLLANTAAGIVVSRLGASSVTSAELHHAIRQQHPLAFYADIPDNSFREIAEARSKGKKIVFTNGCFDILHAGHVNYLSQAKQLGDLLVVGINDDASVKRLKGNERPINALTDRSYVLQGLASVDWVISFSEDTPLSLIQQIRPDILVKGGDYAISDIVGGDVVQSYGGEVKVLPFIDGRSTSKTIEQLGL